MKGESTQSVAIYLILKFFSSSFQRTLQRRLYGHIAEHESLEYSSILPHIIETYNNQKHTSTGYTPKEIIESKEIQENIRSKTLLKKISDKKEKRKRKYKVGDYVRVKIVGEKFTRSYNLRNTIERFRIRKVDLTKKEPRYFLEEEDSTEIVGSFSNRELTLCNIDRFKATPLKEKKVRGKKFTLFKWKGYPDKYNSWQPS